MSNLQAKQNNQMQKSLKGTWWQAIATFLLPIAIIAIVRWALFEPFVIPSGSMIPTLLIHDHIIVKKYALGLRLPFSDFWLMRWREPERGSVLVFKYPEKPEVYYIKRLVGLPGDVIEIQQNKITVNGKSWETTPTASSSFLESDEFDYFNEQSPKEQHLIRMYKNSVLPSSSVVHSVKVPQGSYFFVGDNRDQSSDSRVWGFVPEKYLVGEAWAIWLSCDKMLESSPYLCQLDQIRFDRMFKLVN